MTTRPEALHARIERDFRYQVPTPAMIPTFEAVRAQARAFAHALVDACPASLELQSALTHLEETVMWANAAIARNQPAPKP